MKTVPFWLAMASIIAIGLAAIIALSIRVNEQYTQRTDACLEVAESKWETLMCKELVD